MARPKLPEHEQKSVQCNVRLTPITAARAQLAAQRLGIGVSELLRRRLEGLRLPSPPSEAKLNAEAVAALNRIGVNLNQIARRVNAGKPVNVDRIIKTIDRINDEMDRLNEPD